MATLVDVEKLNTPGASGVKVTVTWDAADAAGPLTFDIGAPKNSSLLSYSERLKTAGSGDFQVVADIDTTPGSLTLSVASAANTAGAVSELLFQFADEADQDGSSINQSAIYTP